MAIDIVGSLFGVSPEMYQEDRNRQGMRDAIAMASLDPMQYANAAIQAGAGRAAGGFAGLMGVEDPQMRLISQRNALAKQFDVSTPEGLAQYGQALQQAGDTQGALGAISIGRQMTQEMARTGQLQAAQRASLATAQKTELTIEQERNLRDAILKLGPNATQEQILGEVTKYGSPDKVLAVLQGTADKAAANQARIDAAEKANQAKIDAAKVAADARIDAAKVAGATALQIAQLRADSAREIAQLVASLKGPSSAVIKAQERADKIAEGQAGLEDTINVAKTLVKDLADMGGMTSTSKGPLSNLITSLQTGTVGQIGGRLVGTKEQAKRDELKSVRLQLLNAVKEATGMSSTQLNSNVELKTYLDSLGSEGMTKEANEAILNNIANRYLRGTKTEPSGNAPKGTAANPIVLK